MKITITDDQGVVVEQFSVGETGTEEGPRSIHLATVLKVAASLAEAGLTSWDE